jgi:hypothetical protein
MEYWLQSAEAAVEEERVLRAEAQGFSQELKEMRALMRAVRGEAAQAMGGLHAAAAAPAAGSHAGAAAAGHGGGGPLPTAAAVAVQAAEGGVLSRLVQDASALEVRSNHARPTMCVCAARLRAPFFLVALSLEPQFYQHAVPRSLLPAKRSQHGQQANRACRWPVGCLPALTAFPVARCRAGKAEESGPGACGSGCRARHAGRARLAAVGSSASRGSAG